MLHHQQVSDHALDSVAHHLFSFEESFCLKSLEKEHYEHMERRDIMVSL